MGDLTAGLHLIGHVPDKILSCRYTFPQVKTNRSKKGLSSQGVTDAFIIHQTRNEKSDWSRAFNQFTIACELDMINAISAADIAFIMSSSTSPWLLSLWECSPQKQNG